VQQRCGDGAVDPRHRAVFQPFLFGLADQRPIDRFPGLRPDRTDGPMQHRLLRQPRQRQAGKGAEGCRIFEVKGQFLVAELALLLQDRAAQHRFRRQPAPPGLVQPFAPQVTRHQAHQDALPIKPVRDHLQLAAHLVSGKDLEYRRLDGAFLTHCRLRRCGLRFGINDMIRSLPETAGPYLNKYAIYLTIIMP
jgi:hypothetical protein